MRKLAVIFGIGALAMAFHLPMAFAQAPPGPIAPAPQEQPAPGTPEAREAAKIVTAYTLPPDLYAKTKHVEKIKVVFFTLSPVYGILLLWLLLRKKLAPKYRDWAEARSGRLFLQVLIFAPLLVLTLDVLSLPLSVFEQWELRNYGLSVQHWGSWTVDWVKGEVVNVIIGIILILILYFVIRKSPRLWWLYFWLAFLGFAALLIFVQPVVIDPMFHKFVPMQEKNPALTASLEQMIHRAGQDIPPERIYWMNASEKVNELNAYVTGIGSSKRMVVWDTTIAKMTTPQVVAVCGHEMGHYVLNHIRKGFTIAAIGSLILFYLGYRLIGGFLAWGGERWGIRSLGDLASLPALLLLLGVATFVLTPATNAISRYFEHQADQYALEVTHGLTPDSGQVAAQAFQVLGEVDLDYPDPEPIDVLLTYDHPATRDRVRFSLTYDPWANGGAGEFVH
jgi:Zn-dependent protease with chaperone function